MGGGRKFRLSDMIPNAWFYKLKEMGKPKPKKHHSHLYSSNSSSLTTSISISSSSHSSASSKTTNSSSLSSSRISTHRTSQYFKRDLPAPLPSSRGSPSPTKNRASSPRRRICGPPDSTSEDYPVTPTHSSVQEDISLIKKDSNFHNLELAPILTKREPNIKSLENLRDRSSSVRRLSVSSPGMKLRTHSPKIMNRKLQGRKLQGSGRRCRKKLSESFAVVKSSVNPKRDFMESMMEMIVENDIKGSKDLEDLLACYLQLNSNEYHEIIVDVFKQIWFDLADIRRRDKNK